MSLLIARNINKKFFLQDKIIDVLEDISLSVNTDESIAILGKSGSGKSSLLHILGGLDKPCQGEVIFKKNSIYNQNKNYLSNYRNNQIGFVFQSYHLLPDLTVYENIILPSSILNNKNAKSTVSELIEIMDLECRINHKPHELSGGEKQRVAIARSLINSPALILADEPTGNLDENTSKHVLNYLFQAINNFSKSIILVTHSKYVANYCNKKYDLINGMLV